MASNPMQRKARNSFLLGMVVTLLLTGAVIAFLFMQMKKLNEENQKIKADNVMIDVLAKDVKSGDKLTSDMFTKIKANKASIPADYVESSSLSGEEETIAKVDLKSKAIVTKSMITTSDNIITKDIRVQEYNMLSLPTDLEDQNYIDVRLMLPTGQDYIVISKKQVTLPTDGAEYLSDTVHMNLSEDEILTMSNAIVEAYRINGSKLYVTKYAEPGLQEAATPTYVTSQAVRNMLATDPNIVEKAKAALVERYNQSSIQRRSEGIEPLLTDEAGEDKVTSKMDESIQSTQEARKKYLQSLGGATTTP